MHARPRVITENGEGGRVQVGRLLVGTSGYEYADWRGTVYPPELPRRQWLDAYAARFSTIEMTRTFYGLPDAGLFESWRRRVPSHFVFSVKFSQYATHRRRLKNAEEPIARFLAASAALGAQRGPVLVQLPTGFKVDVGRLLAFLHATRAHDARWVFEFRDPSWYCDPVYQTLADHQAALCVHDLLPRRPYLLTANFSYLRYHGLEGRSYGDERLTAEANRVVGWLRMGCDLYTYFNNDREASAVTDAQRFRSLLEQRAGRPESRGAAVPGSIGFSNRYP